jgi:hypothetical protein
MLEDAMDICDKMRTILSNGKAITDPIDAADYACAFLLPFKSMLDRHSSIFEHTLYAFPEPFPQPFPSTCTGEDVVHFYHEMLLAVEKDEEHIRLLISKVHLMK